MWLFLLALVLALVLIYFVLARRKDACERVDPDKLLEVHEPVVVSKPAPLQNQVPSTAELQSFRQEVPITQNSTTAKPPTLPVAELVLLNPHTPLDHSIWTPYVPWIYKVETPNHTWAHMAALSRPHEPYVPGHTLILEADFQLQVPMEELWRRVQAVHQVTDGRWDVIVFGGGTEWWQPLEPDAALRPDGIFRLLQCTNTSGYLVHQYYRPRLLQQWQAHLQNSTNNEPQHLGQLQTLFQPHDLWVGFRTPIGDRQGTLWSASESLTQAGYHEHPTHALKTDRPWNRQLVIGLCHVATGKYNQYVRRIHHELSRSFVKPYLLRFYLFTDQPELYSDTTAEGHPLRTYHVERQGFPGDTLYRYHYMLKGAADWREETRFMFYTDVDYALPVSSPRGEVLPSKPGLVATEHLYQVVEEQQHRIKGTPETRPESRACIAPHENMKAYYAGGVQGGTTEEWYQACLQLRDQIDEDDKNHIVALWHDESHWNRYLLDHPPVHILNSSYIYPDFCLEPSHYHDTVCAKLRSHNMKPLMVPLSKNHAEVRSL